MKKLKKMKIKELMNNVFLNPDFGLRGKEIEAIKEGLLKCEELKNVSEFIIIENPHLEDKEGNIIDIKTFKLDDETLFSGKFLIYSIGLTPEIFNPDIIYNSVKDGVCITPPIFDPLDFKSKRKICIEFDSLAGVEKNKIKELSELLKKALESPEEYMIQGEREVIISGVFEEREVKGEVYNQDFKNLNLDYESYKNFSLYYMEMFKDESNGEHQVRAVREILPKRLLKPFKDNFSDGQMITKEKINNFLKEYDDKKGD